MNKRGKWLRAPAVERFFARVNKTGTCWLWTGDTAGDHGYGRFWFNGKNVRAHRWSWEHARGAVPDGLKVLHECDNPICVNPAHLFLGTQLDNMRDKCAKGRQNIPTGEASHAAKLTQAQVAWIREQHDAGVSDASIARALQRSPGTINDIVHGRTWKRTG